MAFSGPCPSQLYHHLVVLGSLPRRGPKGVFDIRWAEIYATHGVEDAHLGVLALQLKLALSENLRYSI